MWNWGEVRLFTWLKQGILELCKCIFTRKSLYAQLITSGFTSRSSFLPLDKGFASSSVVWKAIPSYWQQQLSSRLRACISLSSHLFKDKLFPFLSFHFCLWRLPGSRWWVKGLSGCLSGGKETEKLLPPSPSIFFLPCLCLLEQNWQCWMFSFCNACGQSSWCRVEGLSSGLGELP